MFSDVDVIFLNNISPKEKIKIVWVTSCIDDRLSLQIELHLSQVKELLSFFVLEMQLNEENAF